MRQTRLHAGSLLISPRVQLPLTLFRRVNTISLAFQVRIQVFIRIHFTLCVKSKNYVKSLAKAFHGITWVLLLSACLNVQKLIMIIIGVNVFTYLLTL